MLCFSFSCLYCCSAWYIDILTAWSIVIASSQFSLSWVSHLFNLSQMDCTTSVSSDQKTSGSPHDTKNKVQIYPPSRNYLHYSYLPLKYISNTGISLHHCSQNISSAFFLVYLDHSSRNLLISALLFSCSTCKVIWAPELIWNYAWSCLHKTVLLIAVWWCICLPLDTFSTFYVLLFITKNYLLGSLPPG